MINNFEDIYKQLSTLQEKLLYIGSKKGDPNLTKEQSGDKIIADRRMDAYVHLSN